MPVIGALPEDDPPEVTVTENKNDLPTPGTQPFAVRFFENESKKLGVRSINRGMLGRVMKDHRKATGESYDDIHTRMRTFFIQNDQDIRAKWRTVGVERMFAQALKRDVGGEQVTAKHRRNGQDNRPTTAHIADRWRKRANA